MFASDVCGYITCWALQPQLAKVSGCSTTTIVMGDSSTNTSRTSSLTCNGAPGLILAAYPQFSSFQYAKPLSFSPEALATTVSSSGRLMVTHPALHHLCSILHPLFPLSPLNRSRSLLPQPLLSSLLFSTSRLHLQSLVALLALHLSPLTSHAYP